MSYIVVNANHVDLVTAGTNLEKHEVSFDEAATVLLSNTSVSFIAVGYSAQSRVLMVVCCYRLEDEIRIISARRATRKERKDYEEGI